MASKLPELFEHMRTDKEHYSGGYKGKDFEERIASALTKLGYVTLIRSEIDEEKFVSLKDKVLEKQHPDDIANPFQQFNKHFIVQPYGTQNYPDFLVLDDRRVISIEVKFSDGVQKRPVWNSGLPRPNGIYVFAARKQRDLTFFKGSDVLSVGEVEQLHNFFDMHLREYQKQFNKDHMSEQEYGFAAYVRKTFEQKRTYNPHAILDFFTNPNREQLEKAVISHLL